MKEKILIFIMGALVGAIIATGGWYLYNKDNTNNQVIDGNNQQMIEPRDMQGGFPRGQSNNNSNETATSTEKNGNTQAGTPPEMPAGENGNNTQAGTPPARPSGENSNNQNASTQENNI